MESTHPPQERREVVQGPPTVTRFRSSHETRGPAERAYEEVTTMEANRRGPDDYIDWDFVDSDGDFEIGS